jgi:hypothetical protein
MRKSHRDHRVYLRLATPLFEELEARAARGRHGNRMLERASEPKFVELSEWENPPHTRVLTLWQRNENGEPFAFTEKELALQERLRARLELSQHYERKMKRVKRDIGLAAAERKRDRVCSRQVNIENRILGMPAMTPRDFAKIKIYEHHDRYIGADEIVRDVQRLVKWGEVRAAFAA